MHAISGRPPDDVMLQADPALLSQALINLLRNAADAAAQNASPLVTMACAADAAAIIFTVADNGPGIAPERLNDVFLPFYTTKEDGSGIGLKLARQIVLAHGGQLTAEANPGGGMLFRVTLRI